MFVFTLKDVIAVSIIGLGGLFLGYVHFYEWRKKRKRAKQQAREKK